MLCKSSIVILKQFAKKKSMPYIQFEKLNKLRKQFKDKVIVFCSGGFDLTHPGHVLFLEDCKKHGDILVVGLGSDVVRKIDKQDEGRPILNQHLRLKMVSSLKPVDFAFIIRHLPEKHPLDPIDKIFQKLKPDTYVINSDASHIPYREEMVKRFDVKLVILERWCPPEFDGISTTKLIDKIKKLN